jgi:PAS domain-containing protein
VSGQPPLHPALRRLLDGHGCAEGRPPATEAWAGLLASLSAQLAEADRGREAEAALALEHARLQASEDRFERAVRGTEDGIWDWDVAAGGFYFSPRCLE